MHFELVECTKEYWEFVRILRNDERVLSGFVKSTFIDTKMQLDYMKIHSNFYRISLVDGMPAGYVGVIDDDIRICTHPQYQGIGVGKFMLNKCSEIWPTSFAKVKLDNEASLKLFESCGYIKKYYILMKDK
jgi:GNAT superfamily N-acetyltransferase